MSQFMLRNLSRFSYVVLISLQRTTYSVIHINQLIIKFKSDNTDVDRSLWLRKPRKTSARRPSNEGCAISHSLKCDLYLQMMSVGSYRTTEESKEGENVQIIIPSNSTLYSQNNRSLLPSDMWAIGHQIVHVLILSG